MTQKPESKGDYDRTPVGKGVMGLEWFLPESPNLPRRHRLEPVREPRPGGRANSLLKASRAVTWVLEEGGMWEPLYGSGQVGRCCAADLIRYLRCREVLMFRLGQSDLAAKVSRAQNKGLWDPETKLGNQHQRPLPDLPSPEALVSFFEGMSVTGDEWDEGRSTERPSRTTAPKLSDPFPLMAVNFPPHQSRGRSHRAPISKPERSGGRSHSRRRQKSPQRPPSPGSDPRFDREIFGPQGIKNMDIRIVDQRRREYAAQRLAQTREEAALRQATKERASAPQPLDAAPDNPSGEIGDWEEDVARAENEPRRSATRAAPESLPSPDMEMEIFPLGTPGQVMVGGEAGLTHVEAVLVNMREAAAAATISPPVITGPVNPPYPQITLVLEKEVMVVGNEENLTQAFHQAMRFGRL